MIEMSATVTAGNGSERHNHDLDYRETLQHCHSRENGVIELAPYEKSYKDQINELMKPYIDEYNARVEMRYLSAWERYNNGQIKTKPRKRDYKKMNYDYYGEHVDDMRKNPITGKEEKFPIFRSLIIGIGDKNDKQNLTEQQAIEIFRKMLEQFRKDFPKFKVLGCTIHLDEEGFYHCHLDYKPLYERAKDARGLPVGVGLEGALEAMGYEPEQSVINGRDKVPLLFNAMRNKIYYNLEAQMNLEGVRMQYNVSGVKEPGKDSSKNQKLKDWQETQDKARELQHEKNVALDVLDNPELSIEGYNTAVGAFEKVEKIIDEVAQSERSKLNKNNVLVKYSLFDQLRSFLDQLRSTFVNLLHELEISRDNEQFAIEEAERIKETYVSPEAYADLERKYKNELDMRRTAEQRAQKAQKESAQKTEFMKRYNVKDKTLDQIYEQEHRYKGRSH